MHALFAIALTCTSLLMTDVVRVVTTGDSITRGYSVGRLRGALAEAGIEAEVARVASGGCNTARYCGQEVDPTTETSRDYVALVLEQDPDVILLMLGTNDAMRIAGAPDWLDVYQANMRAVLDRYTEAVNTGGDRPVVVLATLIPIIAPDYAAAAQVVEDQINPWIRDIAVEYGLPCIDLNAQIREQSEWATWYNDGVHLWAEAATGYLWMAERFAAVVPRVSGEQGCACLADLDCSGRVSLTDLGLLIGAFGNDATGDLNFDQRTDLVDLSLLLARFGSTCE